MPSIYAKAPSSIRTKHELLAELTIVTFPEMLIHVQCLKMDPNPVFVNLTS